MAVSVTEVYEMFKEWHSRCYQTGLEKFAKELSKEGYREDSENIIHNAYLSYISKAVKLNL